VNVQAGATLTLQPGTEIHFTNGRALRLRDGGLVSTGTADDPVILRSVDDGAGPGSWIGVIASFESTGLTFNQTTVQDAGADAGGGGGCVTIEDGAGDITIVDSDIIDCEQAAIRSEVPFEAIAGNTIADSTVGFAVRADVIGSIGDGNNSLLTFENVTRNQIIDTTVSQTSTSACRGRSTPISASRASTRRCSRSRPAWICASRPTARSASATTVTVASLSPATKPRRCA
jgi:hypothetical protein